MNEKMPVAVKCITIIDSIFNSSREKQISKKLLNSLPLSVCILCLVIIYFGLAAYGVKNNTFSNLNYIRLFFFGKYLKSFVRSLASEIRDYQTKHRTFKRPPGMLCTTQTWFYRYLHREPSFAPLSRCLILSFYK